MSEHLSGQAGIAQHELATPTEQSNFTQGQAAIEGLNIFNRLRIRNRWTAVAAAAAAVVAIATAPTLEGEPAYAANTETATIGMPFEGKWSTFVHPSTHPNYSADWATDVYAPPGTEARFRAGSASGNATYAVSNVADTSCGAGKRVRVNAKVDGVDVGWVQYDHLDTSIANGTTLQPGDSLGKTRNWGNLPCYQVTNDNGVHLHVGMKNVQDNYSCYVDHGNQGVGLSEGANLGVLGSSNNGEQEACAEIPGGGTNHPPTRDTVNLTSPDKLEDIVWYEQYPGTAVKPVLAAINARQHGGFGIGWKAPGMGDPDWLATGDFDGDGKTDVAWHEGSVLSILKSTGVSYHKAIALSGIGRPDWAAVGDFNNDGKDDIVWYEIYPGQPGTLKTLISNATGTWLDAGFYAVGIGRPNWAAVGDFNGDGYDDVAWHEGSTLSTIASHQGRSWTAPIRSPNIGAPTWAQVGEFTGDNQDDIAWYEAGSSTLTVLPGSNGFFPVSNARRAYGIGSPKWAQVGDFNGDNKNDVAWFEQYPGHPNSLSALISDGNRLNKKWAWIGIGRPNWIGVGDFTGEGVEDLAWHQGSTLSVIASNGSAWGVHSNTPGIGRPVWASRGDFPK